MNERQRLSLERIAHVKRQRGELYKHVPHVCNKAYCDPCNESKLIMDGLLTGNIVDKTVYLCNYRTIHICTPDTCTAVDNGVCRVTGACWGFSGTSTYDKYDHRTWRSKTNNEAHTGKSDPIYQDTNEEQKVVEEKQQTIVEETLKKKKRKHKRAPTLNGIKKICETILITLLYDGQRQKINTRHVNRSKKQCKIAIEKYRTNCLKTHYPINLMHIVSLQYQFHLNPKLPIQTYDIQIIEKYTVILVHMCQLVLKYYSNIEQNTSLWIQSVALSALYRMRRGYTINSIEFLPQDPFLIYMLPEVRELPYFGLAKNKLTRGDKIIDKVYDIAQQSGVMLTELIPPMISQQTQSEIEMRPANYRLKKKLKF